MLSKSAWLWERENFLLCLNFVFLFACLKSWKENFSHASESFVVEECCHERGSGICRDFTGWGVSMEAFKLFLTCENSRWCQGFLRKFIYKHPGGIFVQFAASFRVNSSHGNFAFPTHKFAFSVIDNWVIRKSAYTLTFPCFLKCETLFTYQHGKVL